MDDAELLEQFVRHRSQDAFRRLVERYCRCVYAAAQRQVRDRHLAEDVVQSVFCHLAARAARVDPSRLAGWLLTVTHLSARRVLRAQARRRRYEELAAMKHPAIVSDESDWFEVSAVLDGCLARLSDTDRTIVALRFFQGEDAAAIALSMNLSPAAVRRRTGRALEKLRRMLERRGFTLSTAGLSAMLAASAAEAAPPALVAAAVAAATGATGTLAGGGGVAAVAKGALLAMTLSKAQSVAVGVAISIVVVGGGGLLVYESMRSPAHRPEVVDIAPAVPPQLPPGGRSASPPLPPINFGNLAIRPAAIKLGEEVPLHPLLVLKAQGIDEPALTAWLEAWDRRVMDGQPTTPAYLAELEPLLKGTKLSCMGLYQIGRGMALVAGKDDAALVWYKAAGERAEGEAAGYRPGEPAAEAFVVAMRRMRDAMWATHDYAAIRQFCAAQLKLERPGTAEAHLAESIFVDTLHLEGMATGNTALSAQSVELAQAMLARQGEGKLTPEQRAGVHWLIGFSLYQRQEYRKAIPHIREALAQPSAAPRRSALSAMVYALARCDEAAEAERYYRQWMEEFGNQGTPGTAELAAEVTGAKWRQSMKSAEGARQ